MKRTTTMLLACALIGAGLMVVAAPASAAVCYGISSDTACTGAWFPQTGLDLKYICAGVKTYETGHCTGAQV